MTVLICRNIRNKQFPFSEYSIWLHNRQHPNRKYNQCFANPHNRQLPNRKYYQCGISSIAQN
jgi:hypothetical protein